MTTETANRRMDFAMNIVYLNELKEKLSITNDQLAQMSGVPESTVSRILNGTTDNPNFQTIVDIVRTLKGSIDVMEDLCHTAESAPKETESKKTAEKEEAQKARAEIFHRHCRQEQMDPLPCRTARLCPVLCPHHDRV